MDYSALENSPSPAVHSRNLRRQLTDLIDHLAADRERVAEPEFQTLLDTSAEVLKGVRSAFKRYDAAHANPAAVVAHATPES